MSIFQNSDLYDTFKTSMVKYHHLYSKLQSYVIKLERMPHLKKLTKMCISIYEKYKNQHYYINSNFFASLDKGVQKEFIDAIEASKFIPVHVKTHLLKLMPVHIRTKYFKINVGKLTVNCYVLEHSTQLKKLECHRIASFIMMVVSLLQEIKTSPSRETIAIYIAPTPYKKQFNKDYEEPLTPSNINSGFNVKHGNKNTIVVYRHEECFKVLLHELIHSLGMDINELYTTHNPNVVSLYKDFQKCIGSNYNTSQLLLGETYNDFFTLLIYTLFYSVEKVASVSKLTHENVMDIFMNRYSDECLYGLLKTYTILSYYVSFYDFVNDKKILIKPVSLGVVFKSCRKKPNHDTETETETDTDTDDFKYHLVKKKIGETTTSVIEYYIIKNIAMINSHLILKLREHHKSIMDINNSDSDLYNILQFFYYLSTSEKSQRKYNALLHLFDDIKNDENEITNSLCMSLYC